MTLEEGDDKLIQLLLEHKEEEIIANYPDLEESPQQYYIASKTALARWMRKNSVSSEWGGKGIVMNAIAPGLIETAMTKPSLEDPEIGPWLLSAHPQAEEILSQPNEMAEISKFLLSENNSLLMGQCLFADRGTEALIRGDKIW